MREPKAAFNKAKDLIRMGVSKAIKLEPLDDVIIKVTPTALVVGGGLAGMTAALNLNNQGYETIIVEKQPRLGGMLNSLYKVFPTNQNALEIVTDLKDKVLGAPRIKVFTSSMVQEIRGYIGNYNIIIDQKGREEELKVGTIIIAVGSTYLEPKDEFQYDGQTIITQLELEGLLKEDSVMAHDVVMVQCVNSRNEERPYCSSICCATALKNAIILKEKDRTRNITILFRDLYTPGVEYEYYYKKAREAGVVFVKYPDNKLPKTENGNIIVFNEYLGEIISIPYDLLVLSMPLVANRDNKQLAQLLKVPLEENGFFLEAHVKLRPIDFATDGIFLCGTAKWPANIAESIEQGYAAAARASTILSHDRLQVDGTTAFLPHADISLCTGCNICIKICPFHAIVKDEQGYAHIQEALCKGCGVCGATCPEKAITIKQFTDEQILSEIFAFARE
ncbi:MAG: CoB--CoM heterodisulfide reductase iron-sulfur subunit A family protein [Promethearchaeota archaeon]